MAASTKTGGFSEAEKAAMKERAEELRTSGKGGAQKAREAPACLDKIAELPDEDRVLAGRIHAIVHEVAPRLRPKTMYGMPAYADEDDKVVCFFQAASKFGTRYSTLGFEGTAQLDEGTMWPTTYALTELNATNEKKVVALVRKAVGG